MVYSPPCTAVGSGSELWNVVPIMLFSSSLNTASCSTHQKMSFIWRATSMRRKWYLLVRIGLCSQGFIFLNRPFTTSKLLYAVTAVTVWLTGWDSSQVKQTCSSVLNQTWRGFFVAKQHGYCMSTASSSDQIRWFCGAQTSLSSVRGYFVGIQHAYCMSVTAIRALYTNFCCN